MKSGLKRLEQKFLRGLEKISDGMQDWTPFCLVLSYFVFSITIYMNGTSRINEFFWFIYLMMNTYIATTTAIEAVLALGNFEDSKRLLDSISKRDWTFPTAENDLPRLDILVVAYLPNEQEIVLDRLQFLLEEIVYPRDRYGIKLLYNTPHDIPPIESQLVALAEDNSSILQVFKVPNSNSKAHNINYYCDSVQTEAEISAVFDCDHYPHPYSPKWAMERFARDSEVDIVQGRCVIFNARENFLTSMIAIEFDKIYAVSHPGRAAMYQFGLFCGSNGYWRTSLLRQLKMDESMLTEDIDSALRALGCGAKVVHDNNVISFELAPVTIPAFWKQRLRWAQGWIQASMRHVHLIWSFSRTGRVRSKRQRFGIFSLLFIREISYYLITQYLCFVLSAVITDFPRSGQGLFKLVFFQYPIALWLFNFSFLSFIGTLWITFHTRSEFCRWYSIPLFLITYLPQLILTAIIGLFGHARQVSKYAKWNPTPRH